MTVSAFSASGQLLFCKYSSITSIHSCAVYLSLWSPLNMGGSLMSDLTIKLTLGDTEWSTLLVSSGGLVGNGLTTL